MLDRFPLGGCFVVQIREDRFGIVTFEVVVGFLGASEEGLLPLVQNENLVGDFEGLVAVRRQDNRVSEEGELL